MRRGNYYFSAISYKMKTRSKKHGSFSLYCLQPQFNYVLQATFNNNYNYLPLYAKPPSVWGRKTLGRYLRRLLEYHLVKAVVSVSVHSADVHYAPTVCRASVRSYRRWRVNESWSPFSKRAGKRPHSSNQALICLFSQHSLLVFSVPVPMLGKQR